MVSIVSHVKDEVIADIEARIAAWTFLPVGIFVTACCHPIISYPYGRIFFSSSLNMVL